MNDEYQSVRNAQDEVFDKVDGFEGGVLGLNEAVNRNSEQIAEVRHEVAEVKQELAETNQKLDAIIKHLKVPYDKPPSGFIKDRTARDLTQFR